MMTGVIEIKILKSTLAFLSWAEFYMANRVAACRSQSQNIENVLFSCHLKRNGGRVDRLDKKKVVCASINKGF